MTIPASPYDDAATCTACGAHVLYFPKFQRYIDAAGSDFCGIAYDGLHTTVPQRHPNFYLWEVIDGLLQLHDTPEDDRECAWCGKPAVILLPASRNDNAWPQLTRRACFDHSGLDSLVNGEDGTAPYVTQYLNYFETKEN